MENRKYFLPLALFLAWPGSASAQVVSYECDEWPEVVGFSRAQPNPIWCQRNLDAGDLVLTTPAIPDPEFTQQDWYDRSISEFAGTEALFVEWRLGTTGSRDGIGSASPAVITPYGHSGISYHFTMASDRMRFITPSQSVFHFDVQPGMTHVYRLEVRGKAWTIMIDGHVVNTGMAQKNYPTSDSRIVFGAASYLAPAETRWDYIRYGVIPDDAGAGDLNCDGTINQFDINPFIAALVSADGYGQQHPACNRMLADTTGDGTVNQFDIIPFVDLLMP